MDKELDGNKIRIIRESLGLDKREFSRKLGVSSVSLWAWESGKARPSPLAREKLTKAQYYSETDKETPHQF